MKQRAKTGILLGALALTSAFGCSKDEQAKEPTTNKTQASQDVPGKSSEALLVLKFHRDG